MYRKATIVVGVALVLVGVALVLLMGFVTRDQPEQFADIRDHFKYGSIGSDTDNGVPYWIWRVLPTVFADKLPNRDGDGYARMGFVYEAPDRDRPIGTSIRDHPIPLVGLNCAACHTGTIQAAPGAPAQIVLGMPAQQFDIESYFEFLFGCADDPRFTPDVLIPAIEQVNPSFGLFDKLLYRFVVIPRTKAGLLARASDVRQISQQPRFGPGRVDTFGQYKLHFGLPLGDAIGTADLPSLWNQRPRQGLWLHWDGNNNRVEERNISAALGAGATEDSLDEASLARIRDWIFDVKPPLQFPADKIDQTQLQAGQAIYQQRCATCHEFGAARIGQTTPLAEIGTDPERHNSFTPELSDKMNTFGMYKSWRFSHFRVSDGYANMPLDGLWLRAPYLHNGSVPTLHDLLEPPDRRPTVFYRGYDVYDFANVGFVSNGPEAERTGFRYDTSVPGNNNGGHVYGTDLSPAEKAALLEFLKTL
jgi:mono/diheme cytochrome c family protein